MLTLDELWNDVRRTHQALANAVKTDSAAEKRFDASSSWKAENKSEFDMLFKCGLVTYDSTYHGGFVLTEVPTEEHKKKYQEYFFEKHTEE